MVSNADAKISTLFITPKFFDSFLSKKFVPALFFTIFASMLQKTEAIILRNIKYNDTKNIVTTYTRESGRKTFLARRPRSRRGSIRQVYLQPLCPVVLEYDERKGRSLNSLSGVYPTSPLKSIPFHPSKIYIAMFLADFLDKVIRGSEKDEPLFRFLIYSVGCLDAVEGTAANFHIAFLVHLSQFMGFMPDTSNFQTGMFFDMEEGIFTHSIPTGGIFLNAADSEAAAAVMRMRYENMHLYKMSREERRRCIEVIIEYYKIHMPGFPQPKSLDIFKEAFD